MILRTLETAKTLARIAGIRAGARYLHRAGEIALAGQIDELCAYLQLVRARLLRKI